MTLMAMLLAFAMFLAITPNVFAAATAATLSYASSDVLPVLANDLLSMRFDLCSKSVGGGHSFDALYRKQSNERHHKQKPLANKIIASDCSVSALANLAVADPQIKPNISVYCSPSQQGATGSFAISKTMSQKATNIESCEAAAGISAAILAIVIFLRHKQNKQLEQVGG